jgi:DNA replicative helicase MCM subunit Mcm2 (Cdc46/Mcm family)
MIAWLRLAEAAARVHLTSTVMKTAVTVAVKVAKSVLHSNIGLIGLTALLGRFGG